MKASPVPDMAGERGCLFRLRLIYCRPPGFTVMPPGKYLAGGLQSGCTANSTGAQYKMLGLSGNKEVSTNNRYKFAAIFIVFPGFFLNILQEPLREPCNQREIVAVIFRQFLVRPARA